MSANPISLAEELLQQLENIPESSEKTNCINLAKKLLNSNKALVDESKIISQKLDSYLLASQIRIDHSSEVSLIGNYTLDLIKGTASWDAETFLIFDLDPSKDEEPTMESYAGYLHPEDAERVFQKVDESIAKGLLFNEKYRIITAKGAEKWVHSIGSLIRNEFDQPISMVGTFHDVTIQEKALLDLKEREANLDTIVKNSKDLINTVDSKDRYVYASGNENFNIPNDHLIGKTIDEIHKPETAKVFKSRYKTVRKEKKTASYETKIDWEGKTYFFQDQVVPIFDKNGNVSKCITYSRDVTEKELSKQKILQKNDQLVSALNISNGSIWAVDKDFRLIFFNSNFENDMFDSFGKKMKQGDCVLDLKIPEEQINKWRELYRRAFNGKKFSFEHKRIFKKEEEWTEYICGPYTNKKGEILGATLIAFNVTERKQIQEKLNQESARLRALLNNSNAFIWSVDKDYKMDFVNQSAIKLQQESVNKIFQKGKSAIEGLNPDSLVKKIKPLYERAIQGESFSLEHKRQFAKKNDWLELHFGPVLDENQNPIGATVIGHNITNRKKAEIALRESEQKFYNLFDNMAQGVFIQAADGNLLDANQACLKIFGLQKDEFIGNNSYNPNWKIISEKGKPIAPENHPSMLCISEKKEVASIIGLKNLKTRNNTWLYIHAVPIFKHKKELDYVIVNMTDISELKKTEERLNTRSMQINVLIDAVPSSLLLMKPSGEIEIANKFLAESLNMAKSEVIGKNAYELIGKELAKSRKIYLDQVVKKKTPQVFVDERKGIKIENNVFPVLNKKKNVTSLAILGRDITEQWQKENQMKMLINQMTSAFALLKPVYDIDGNIKDFNYVNVNEALSLILNKNRESLIGNPIMNMFPETENIWIEFFRKVLLSGKSQRMVHMHKPSGKFFSCNAYKPLADTEQIAVIFEDVTNRKEYETELIKNQNLLELTQALGKIGTWQVDILKNRFIFSDQHAINTGINPRKIYSPESILKTMPAEEANKYKKAWKNAVKNRTNFELVQKLETDGVTRWIRSKADLYTNEDGEVVSANGFSQDITNIKQLENQITESRDELRRLAINLQNIREEERKMIATEIHDDFGQSLTAIKISLKQLQKMIFDYGHQDSRETIKEEMQGLLLLVDKTAKQIKHFANQLRPDILDTFGILEAIKIQAEDFEKQFKINCKVSTKLNELELNPAASIAIYRIIQEALTNVVRHAKANKVEISISKTNKKYILLISDNGIGFPSADTEKNFNLGLVGMKERALAINADIEIQSEESKGTKIVISLNKS